MTKTTDNYLKYKEILEIKTIYYFIIVDPAAVWSVFIVEEEKAMKTIYQTYAWKSEP